MSDVIILSVCTRIAEMHRQWKPQYSHAAKIAEQYESSQTTSLLGGAVEAALAAALWRHEDFNKASIIIAVCTGLRHVYTKPPHEIVATQEFGHGALESENVERKWL